MSLHIEYLRRGMADGCITKFFRWLATRTSIASAVGFPADHGVGVVTEGRLHFRPFSYLSLLIFNKILSLGNRSKDICLIITESAFRSHQC